MKTLLFLWHILRGCYPFAGENRVKWTWSDCWQMAVRDTQPDFVRDILRGLADELRKDVGTISQIIVDQDDEGYRLCVGRRGFLEDPQLIKFRITGHECQLRYERNGPVPGFSKQDIWAGQREGRATIDLNDPQSIDQIREFTRSILGTS